MNRLHMSRLSFIALLASALSACGGGSGNDPIPYGAIAYSPITGRAAIVTNLENDPLARQEAYSRCGFQGCEHLLSFSGKGTCGAIAASSNGTVGAGSGPSKAEAERVALTQCTSRGGNDCSIPAALPTQCM